MAQDNQPLDRTLLNLGLVDPKTGRPTTAANWGGEFDQKPEDIVPAVEGDVLFPQDQERERPKAEWDSEENPYKKDAEAFRSTSDPNRARSAAARTTYETKVQQLMYQAQAAHNALVSAKDEKGQSIYSPQIATAIVEPILKAEVSKAYTEAMQEALLPTAARQVAEDIVRKVGNGVTVEDIIDQPNPQAMEAVARKVSSLNRGERFEQRRQSGADRAESGAPGVSTALPESFERLNPKMKIKYGLIRGDH